MKKWIKIFLLCLCVTGIVSCSNVEQPIIFVYDSYTQRNDSVELEVIEDGSFMFEDGEYNIKLTLSNGKKAEVFYLSHNVTKYTIEKETSLLYADLYTGRNMNGEECIVCIDATYNTYPGMYGGKYHDLMSKSLSIEYPHCRVSKYNILISTNDKR